MSSILFLCAIFLLGTSSISAKSIAGLPETPGTPVNTPDGTITTPLVQMSNETVEQVYKEADKIINATGADSVLMQLEPTVIARSSEEQASKGLMLLVVKKPNMTETMDIKEKFNAFYISSAKADPADANNMVSAVWNVMLDSAREFVNKRLQSLMQIIKMLPGSLQGMSGIGGAASAAGGAAGRTPTIVSTLPIVFKPSDVSQEPRVILLIPEQMTAPIADSPDVGVVESNAEATSKNLTDNPANVDSRNLTDSDPIPVPSSEDVPQEQTIGVKTPRFLGLTGFGTPARLMLRPVGALSGMNVQPADKAFTSIGTMVTNTGLHFSLVGHTGSSSGISSFLRRLILIASLFPKQ